MSKVIQFATKIYEWTESTFIKREYAESERQKDVNGNPIIWKFGPQRLRNEYNALRFIAEKTTILVPKVIKFGTDTKGATFLEVERMNGLEYGIVGEECRMPEGKTHVASGKCATCERTAKDNVERYMTATVIPQLQALRSNQTGLNGFVLPPPRIEEYSSGEDWLPKTSSENDSYVFCHGDLARHNIMLNPRSLKVMCIYDWEHAGFYPLSLELPLWKLDYDGYIAIFRDENKIKEEIALIW